MSEPLVLPDSLLPRHPARLYRERHNLRLTDLASRAGMSVGTLSRIETGETELPNCAAIQALSRATDHEIGEIDIFRWHYRVATGEEADTGTIGYRPSPLRPAAVEPAQS